jgi:hypothetical protein
MVGYNDIYQPDGSEAVEADVPINMFNLNNLDYGPHNFHHVCTVQMANLDLDEYNKLLCISSTILIYMESTMSMLYSEDNINKYIELREQILKPHLLKVVDLNLLSPTGPIVYDPVLFIWYFNTFKNHDNNALVLLNCNSKEKILGIQIILMSNLTAPRQKIVEWISVMVFHLIYHDFPDAFTNLLGVDITYETFIDRLSED